MDISGLQQKKLTKIIYCIKKSSILLKELNFLIWETKFHNYYNFDDQNIDLLVWQSKDNVSVKNTNANTYLLIENGQIGYTHHACILLSVNGLG